MFRTVLGLFAHAVLVVAISAVDRLTGTRLERNLGLFAAGGANGREHLRAGSGLIIATAGATTRTSRPASGAASGAALRLISVAAIGEQFLLFSGELERLTALSTS